MDSGPNPVVILSVWLVGAASIAASLVLLSRLVRIQRERHPVAWERDGRPPAPWLLLWSIPPPGDPSRPRSPFDLMRTNRLLVAWLFRTPDWARYDSEAQRLLWSIRALQAIGIAVVWVWFVLLTPLIGRQHG